MSANLRTPLGKIEGLGSARAGTEHFWQQRVTAVALAPLSIWFVASVMAYVGADQGAVASFFSSPINAVLMFLFLAAAIHHMRLGLQIIVEDYVHQEGLKVASLILVRFASLGVGAAAGLALLKLAVSGQ